MDINQLTKKMKLFLYGLIASAGILGLLAGFFPQYQIEIFLGWILPVLAGIVTIYFVINGAEKGPLHVTKSLAIGFNFFSFLVFLII